MKTLPYIHVFHFLMIIAVARANLFQVQSELDFVEECLKQVHLESFNFVDTHSSLGARDLEAPWNKPTVHRTGCYLACMYEKEGIMVNSKIDLNRLTEIIKEVFGKYPEWCQELLQLINKCANRVIDDNGKCKTALDFASCIYGIN